VVRQGRRIDRAAALESRWHVLQRTRQRHRSTTIWRSSQRQSPTLYAHLGKECKLVSMDRDAHSAVCQVSRDESDVFVGTRP
jgi:hypothetical protein